MLNLKYLIHMILLIKQKQAIGNSKNKLKKSRYGSGVLGMKRW